MGKLGLAFRCFFRVFKDPEFATLAAQPTLPLPSPAPLQLALQKELAPLPPSSSALQLLAVLQQEGRFVDFLQEDLSPLEDEQIGAAVRNIHENCRKQLNKFFEILPVIEKEEGEALSVPQGFDPTAWKLVGEVQGHPPFQGILRHHGWKISLLKNLPQGENPSILTPAEIEIQA
jgi:hypothetical protein